MTPEERALEYRRLANVYRSLACHAESKARALEVQSPRQAYFIEVDPDAGVTLYGPGGRPVEVGLSVNEGRRYEGLLNAGLITEAELPW